MPPKLLKATIEDMPDVARLFRISRESEMPYLPKLHTAEEDLEYFKTVLFPHNAIQLLKDGERLLGFVVFDFDWVHHLYVLPQEMGKGYGTRLLKTARSYRKRIKLWAFKRNERAIRFYEKHGFHIVKETDGSGNEEKEPDVLMHWPAIKWQKFTQVRIYDGDGLREALEAVVGKVESDRFGWQIGILAGNFTLILKQLGMLLPSYTHLYVYFTTWRSEGQFAPSHSIESWFRAIGIGISPDSLAKIADDQKLDYIVNLASAALIEISKEDSFIAKPIEIARDLLLHLREPDEMVYACYATDEFIIVVSQTMNDRESQYLRAIKQVPMCSSSVYVTWLDMRTNEIKRKFALDLKFAWQIEHFVNGASVKGGEITLRPKSTAKTVLEKTTIIPGTTLPIRVKMD